MTRFTVDFIRRKRKKIKVLKSQLPTGYNAYGAGHK